MKPRTMHMPQPGVYVFDFGQNFAGRVALTIPTNQVGREEAERSTYEAPTLKLATCLAVCLQMRKGANVTLRHAEVLQHVGIVERPQSGMLYVDNLRSARATDTYIFGGTQPHHTATPPQPSAMRLICGPLLLPVPTGQSLRPSRRRGHHKGESVVYEPTFTYHGFRYVEVTGIQPTIGTD